MTWRMYARKNVRASSAARSGSRSCHVVDPRPVDALQHEHAVGHERVDHLGNEQVVAVVLEHLRDQLCVVRLLAEVELVEQVLLELVGERVQLQQLGSIGVLLGDGRCLAQQIEVELPPARRSPAVAP